MTKSKDKTKKKQPTTKPIPRCGANPDLPPPAKISKIESIIPLVASNSDAYRKMQNSLQSCNIPFHSFSFPADRKLKVLLRGIPTLYTEEKVKEELHFFGYESSHVRQFVKEGRKLPMYMVVLPNDPTNKSIFNLPSLFYIYI